MSDQNQPTTPSNDTTDTTAVSDNSTANTAVSDTSPNDTISSDTASSDTASQEPTTKASPTAESTAPTETAVPKKIAVTDASNATPSDSTASNATPAKKAKPKPAKKDYIPVHEPTAEKKRVHPRFASGKYTNIRLVSMYLILVGFLFMPWLKWNGHQALLFDVSEPKFYIFGATFMPQDFFFFAFVFIIAAILLFMVTVYAGRVWCGYACPQTIYVHMYQHVEKWVLGERNKRMKFDKEPMSASKFAKIMLIQLIWGVMSVITALTFVALVVGTDYLFFNGNPVFFLGWSKMTWIFFLLIAFVTHINAGYMREHMCVHICPYGRFQSVMFDKDTLIVSYDYKRGEPRGARKKGAERPDLGDCVDCTMCVQVCPTGIDIRDGLQVECIQCAACIDACNEIMDKVGSPRGLIRYTTERQLVENEKTKIISPRIFAYIAVLAIAFTAAGFLLEAREPIELDIRHDRRALSKVIADGKIQNSYVLKIVNKTEDKQTYLVKLEPIDGIELKSRFKNLPLGANEAYDMPVNLVADPAKVNKGRTPVTFTIYTEDGKYSESESDFFVVE